jgi:hypothetical protein
MRIIKNVEAATSSETSLLSESIDEGGSTAVVANVYEPLRSWNLVFPVREAQAVIDGLKDLKVKYFIVVGTSSTTKEIELPQPVSSDSGPESACALVGGKDLYETLLNLFTTARQEDFEDGVHTGFSRELVRLIEIVGTPAISVITSIINKEKVNPAVSAEALKWISHIDQPRSYAFRLWLLEKSLQSSSSRIRDAALIGIAAADDPHSIPAIKDAIRRETCQELREDLNQVLSQLDSQCHLYSEK